MADTNPPDIRIPRPPAHLAPYLEVLGWELAIRFLLSFGGAKLYMPEVARGRSEAEAMLGKERLDALSERLGAKLTIRVPTGNPWIIATLRARGMAVNEIARKVRVTDVTVYKWLHHAKARAEEGKPV